MNRQEAIRALVLAGRADEVEEAINDEIDAAQTFYKEVRSDTSRTEEYRRRELAQAFVAHDDSLTKKLVKLAGTAVRIDHNDAETVFGVAGLPGDAATLIISRRDAVDRVAEITASGELRELLARATRTGDEVLARAVAERALSNRDAKTLQQFVEDRPQLEESVVRLWGMERRGDQADHAGMGSAILLTTLKPEELSGMSFGSIRALADADEPTGVDLDDPTDRVQWRY